MSPRKPKDNQVDADIVDLVKKFSKEEKEQEALMNFFFVWMLHGSTLPLSGRSPFCQLQIVKMSQQTLDETSTEATTSSKIKQYQPQSSLPESAKGG